MTTPDTIRAALPEPRGLPRVGKIRLGETYEGEKRDGTKGLFPRSTDHFRVELDESGITSQAAADAFHDFYGDAPTTLHVQLVRPTPAENLAGAWRLYGQSKLKRKCDGATCVERTSAGWQQKPCVCDDLPEDSTNRCKLTHTLQFLLPDVKGVGVWEITTGSEISVANLVAAFELWASSGISLAGHEFDLTLAPVKVAPDGVSKTVYVLQPAVDFSRTPREVIEAAANAQRPTPVLPPPGEALGELPPVSMDEDSASSYPPAPTASPLPREDAVTVSGDHDAGAPPPPPETPTPDSEGTGEAEAANDFLTDVERFTALRAACAASHKALTAHEKAKLSKLCGAAGVRSSDKGIAEWLGEDARDLHEWLAREEQVVAYIRLTTPAGEQATL